MRSVSTHPTWLSLLTIAALMPLYAPAASAQAPRENRVHDRFDAPLDQAWNVFSGKWRLEDGRLHGGPDGDIVWSDVAWRNAAAQVEFSMTDCRGPAYWAGIFLRGSVAGGRAKGYLVYLRLNGSLEIFRAGRILATAETNAADRLAAGESVRLGIRAHGDLIQGLLDGDVLVEVRDDRRPWGAAGLALCGCRAIFDNFQCTGTAAGNTIWGQVVSAAGQQPVPNARVETYHSMDGYDSLAIKSTTTDANGFYYLTDLPAGERAYWVRTCKPHHGGGTGWFVTVADNEPTRCDLILLDKPPATVWVDSPSLQPRPPLREIDDPQCYGQSRAVLRCDASDGPPQPVSCSFTVDRPGHYSLHLAIGLYPQLHYWSPCDWRVDDGSWRSAADTLTFGPRYGDRLSCVWARTAPMYLDAGHHRLDMRVTGLSPGGEYYWTFDALAVAREPGPIGPTHSNTSRPVLRWHQGPVKDVVLQVSAERDFADATITIPRPGDGEWPVPQSMSLPDGHYWWRVKSLMPETSSFTAGFGPPQKLVIDTPAPAVSRVHASPFAPNRAAVSWQTDQPCRSWLEWDCSAIEPRFRTSKSNGTDHRVTLTDLQPMTCYRYWVVVQHGGERYRGLRRQFLTPRGPLTGKQSPFGVFGQSLPYARQFGQAGVKWFSDYWSWSELEPRRGQFIWDQAERRMQLARRNGLNLTVTFWGTPAWIRPSHRDQHGWDFTYGPDDLAAASEFFEALAAHCRGRVDTFLPWIEPNVARDTTFGFPRGYWASRPHATTYTEYQNAAYAGAKAGNPDCRLVGMNTAGVDLKFIEKCYDRGAADTFDVMNVHYYAMTGDFENQNPRKLFARLRHLMAQYGDAHKPIICSEGGGTSSGLPGTNEQMQAENLVRIYILSIANNIDKLCWTFSHDIKPYGSERKDMIMWMGLFRYDPHAERPYLDAKRGQPKPAFFAYRNMIDLLEGSLYRGRLHLGEGVWAYRFDKPIEHGSWQRITAIWSPGEPADVQLQISGRINRCIDHLGAPRQARLEAGRLHLRATSAPAFVLENLTIPHNQ